MDYVFNKSKLNGVVFFSADSLLNSNELLSGISEYLKEGYTPDEKEKFFSYDDDSLEIRFKPDEKFDLDVSKLGLSEVNVNISFKIDNEDLLLDVAYHGSHIRGWSNVASRVYRRVYWNLDLVLMKLSKEQSQKK
jgi:hypothetical protein